MLPLSYIIDPHIYGSVSTSLLTSMSHYICQYHTVFSFILYLDIYDSSPPPYPSLTISFFFSRIFTPLGPLLFHINFKPIYQVSPTAHCKIDWHCICTESIDPFRENWNIEFFIHERGIPLYLGVYNVFPKSFIFYIQILYMFVRFIATYLIIFVAIVVF